MAYQNLEVVHVVAMDQQRCIGKGNALPWHISADLKHFKDITQGGVVVMGRKTLESMDVPCQNVSIGSSLVINIGHLRGQKLPIPLKMH